MKGEVNEQFDNRDNQPISSLKYQNLGPQSHQRIPLEGKSVQQNTSVAISSLLTMNRIEKMTTTAAAAKQTEHRLDVNGSTVHAQDLHESSPATSHATTKISNRTLQPRNLFTKLNSAKHLPLPHVSEHNVDTHSNKGVINDAVFDYLTTAKDSNADVDVKYLLQIMGKKRNH